MIRLVIPLFVLTVVLFVVTFILHKRDRTSVLLVTRNVAAAFGIACLILLFVSLIFMILEGVK